MSYDRQILEILSEVGERGIGVRTLAKHVYNMNCTLFSAPDFGEIHRYVQQFLLRNSKSSRPLVESTGRWGCYRLNTANSADARQLMFRFGKNEAEDKADDDDAAGLPPCPDLSLSLFD